jgi:hypothetical protein
MSFDELQEIGGQVALGRRISMALMVGRSATGVS